MSETIGNLAISPNAVVALYDDISDEDLAKLTGQASGGDKNGLAKAYVNRAHDDDKGNIYPAGTFAVPVDGRDVFSKTCLFRVYMRVFQYTDYLDKKDAPDGIGKYLNNSIQFPDIFMKEVPDALGGNKCGKLTAKQKLQGMSIEVEAFQKRLKTTQILYGTMTFPRGGLTAVNAEGEGGEIVEVNEVPCVFKLPQSSFFPVDKAIKEITEAGKKMQKHPIAMSLERAQNGSTTYYIVKPVNDFLKSSDFDMGLLKNFAATVGHINKGVMDKYHAVQNGTVNEQDAKDKAMFIPDADLDDEIPF